jgi:hypothetical protein
VADEDRRAVLLVEYAAGHRHVVVEGQRRVLDDADIESLLREEAVDAFPARAVDESAVDKRHVLCVGHADLLRSLMVVSTSRRESVITAPVSSMKVGVFDSLLAGVLTFQLVGMRRPEARAILGR